MRITGIKITLAAMSAISFVSLAAAGDPSQGPTQLPEPGTFGMFAGAIAIAIIMTRIIKKK
jgi:hypothetical protein